LPRSSRSVLTFAATNEVSGLPATGIVLNPDDWQTIQLIKESGSGISSGQYIFSDPQSAGVPQLWGRPVVESHSMTAGEFLVGAFNVGAAIWDRNDATVEVSREHGDFFVKNMVAILAEERLALTVYRPSAFVHGGFPYGS
jgi:HK97 family phage major capsid protein